MRQSISRLVQLVPVLPGIFFLLILFHGLENQHGMYNPGTWLRFFLAFIPLVYFGLNQTSRTSVQARFTPRALAFLLAAFVFLSWWDPLKLLYAVNPYGNPSAYAAFLEQRLWVAGSALCFLIAYFLRPKIAWGFGGLTAVLLILQRVLVLFSSPNPRIDVFSATTEAARFLWAGSNPYTQVYTDIYQGAYTYAVGFPYLPGLLLWVTPFFKFFGDVRASFIFCDLIAFGFIFLVALRTSKKPLLALLASTVWLAAPIAFFVLEQSWIDPLLMMAIAGLLYATHRKSTWGMGFALGALLSIKQYSVFLVVFFLIWLFKNASRKSFLKTVTLMIVTSLAIVGPFFFANPSAFYLQTVSNLAHHGIRNDSLSILAFLSRHEVSSSILRAIQTAAYGLTFIGLIYWLCSAKEGRLRSWAFLTASMIQYGVLFLFGSMAFCNYYYFLGFVVFVQMLFTEPQTL